MSESKPSDVRDGEIRDTLESLVYAVAPNEDGHSEYDSAEEQEEASTEAVNKAYSLLAALLQREYERGRRKELETWYEILAKAGISVSLLRAMAVRLAALESGDTDE